MQLRCKRMTLDDWQEVLSFLNPNMELLNETPPTNKGDLKCHCIICNGTFSKSTQVVRDNYFKKIRKKSETNWCPVCNNKMVISGINDLATLRPDLVKYFKNKEDAKTVVPQSAKIVELECPDCHAIKKSRVQELFLVGFYCKECDPLSSYPNKFCRALLSLLPVEEYEIEYNQKWTKGKRYDGYFIYDNKKYLLEFDGKQHFTNTAWGTKDKQNQNDTIKNQLAKEHGYILIRIECIDSSFLYIKNQVYKSKLAEIFDLDSVDWNLLYEKASVGTLKEIADFYNTHHLMNKDIAKQLHYSPTTVKTYLKKANEIGLINYTSKKYTKDYDFLYELCGFFINNQNYSNAMLAKKYKRSTASIYSYLKRGITEGILDITKFTEDAFKLNRFSYLNINQKILK